MKRAVALRYDPSTGAGSAGDGGDGQEDDAPVVVCAGEGALAERIERAARACGVPVVRDIPVCEALAELRAGDPIPDALYEAVAVILRELAV